jgi:hypothetical protein
MIGFPRSFLFSARPFRVPVHMRPVALPSGFLAISSDYSASVGTAGSGPGETVVVLVGYALDHDDANATDARIAQNMAEVAAARGLDFLLAYSDRLLGRFAAICHIGGEWWVFNDACATRSVYFSQDGAWVASHSTLIARKKRLRPYGFFRNYAFGLPGNRSVFPGIRVLVPNFVLHLPSASLRRFWPWEERREQPVATLVADLSLLFQQSAEAIANRWRPCVSVTAGIDSRVTLAAFGRVPTATFFTYDRGQRDRVDLELARLLCTRLGREHRRLTPVQRQAAAGVYAAISSTHDYRHFAAAAPMYKANFGPGDIHVRSNLCEIGRAFWRQHTGTASFDPAKWVRVLEAIKQRHRPRHPHSLAFAEAAFVEMFRELGYDGMDPANPQLLGYDGWDLFYWEHRMPTWHSRC